MSLRIGINGFGRIGRNVLRAAVQNFKIEIVGINDLIEPDYLAYMLQYDPVHCRSLRRRHSRFLLGTTSRHRAAGFREARRTKDCTRLHCLKWTVRPSRVEALPETAEATIEKRTSEIQAQRVHG